MAEGDVSEVGAVAGVSDGGVVTGSFESFYGSQHRHVVRVVYALCGSWSVAEEVTQEAFLRALRRWSELETMQRPDAWVRRVACNLAASRFRRFAIEAKALLRSGSRQVEAEVDPLPADLERFWQLVRRLPGRQAQAVALFYVDDLPIVEVAEVMGCAEGTVKAHLHAARQRLRELYEGEEVHRDTHADR